MDFLPEPMTYLAIGSWSNKGARDGFLLVEWALNPIKNWLVILLVFGQLLHQVLPGQSLLWLKGFTAGCNDYFSCLVVSW